VQSRFELSGKWIKSSPINVVVVAGVETRELIGRFECHKVLVKRYESGVVSSESLLGKVEIEVERRQRLIVDVRVHTEDRPGPGSSGALQTAAGEGALHRPASVDPGLTGKYSLNPNITLDLCRFLGRRARAMTALSPKDADCGDVHCQQQAGP